MNTRVLYLMLAALAIGVVSTAIFRSFQPSGTAVQTAAGDGAQYNWVEHAKQSYSLSIHSDVQLRFAEFDFARDIKQHVEGKLHMRIFDVEAGHVRVGFEFEPGLYRLDGESAGLVESDLSQPFVVRYDANGRPVDFEFQPGVVRPARILLEESLRLMQVVLPDSQEPAWQTEEEHATGRYRAAYERLTRPGEVVKRKEAYTTVNIGMTSGTPTSRARVDLVEFQGDFTIAADASWLESASVSEKLVVFQGAEQISQAVIEARLTRLHEPAAQARLFAAAGWSELVAAAPVKQADDPGPLAPRPSGEQLSRQIAHLNASDENRATTVRQLGALIATDPQFAEQVVNSINGRGLSGRTDALLINALQLGGTPAAQAALVQLMNDPIDLTNNRSRAVVALGSLAIPDEKSIAALHQTALQRNDAKSATLSNTAMLALGSIGRTLRDVDPERSRAVGDLLTLSLQQSADPLEAAVALKAMANTRDSRLTPTVSKYLSHAAPQVRAAAIDALGRFGNPATAATLIDVLRMETDSAVVAMVVKSLDELPTAPREALALVNERVVQERSSEVRYHMTRYLAHNLEQYPEAQATLTRLAVKDSSYRVRKLAWATIAHRHREETAANR